MVGIPSGAPNGWRDAGEAGPADTQRRRATLDAARLRCGGLVLPQEPVAGRTGGNHRLPPQLPNV